MSDYTELVQRLRDSQHNNIIAGWEGDARDDREAADAITKLSAERDYAMEMVNVQDGQIDALRALLKVARDCIYSLDAREIYADELALIDAALAEGRS